MICCSDFAYKKFAKKISRFFAPSYSTALLHFKCFHFSKKEEVYFRNEVWASHNVFYVDSIHLTMYVLSSFLPFFRDTSNGSGRTVHMILEMSCFFIYDERNNAT